jgi:hypothetical protein
VKRASEEDEPLAGESGDKWLLRGAWVRVTSSYSRFGGAFP